MKAKETPEKHPEFDPETYTDPILEECYRIKAEISTKFKKPGEYYKYLKAMEEEDKRNGLKYIPMTHLNGLLQKNLKMINHEWEPGRTGRREAQTPPLHKDD